MTTVEKSGNPEAVDPGVYTERILKSVEVVLNDRFDGASDTELLQMGKNPKLKEVKNELTKVVNLNRFLMGDVINADAYDTIKHLINEPYGVDFPMVKEFRHPKDGGEPVVVIVKKAVCITTKELNVKAASSLLDAENIMETNKAILNHQSIANGAQGQKMVINGNLRIAKSIAQKHQSDNIKAKTRSLHEIWAEVQRKEHAKEQGIEYKEIIPETSVLFEEPILAGFL